MGGVTCTTLIVCVETTELVTVTVTALEVAAALSMAEFASLTV